MLKKTLISLYILAAVIMAAATFIEKYKGTEYVGTAIYGSWWFSLVWALLVAAGAAWMLKRRVGEWHTVVLHASFAIILLGALVTHLSGIKGIVHLRQGAAVDHYESIGTDGNTERHKLPFILKLDSFSIDYYHGTTAEQDYRSLFTVIDGRQRLKADVSMNNIYQYRQYRFLQNSYDPDGRGTYLSVSSDPWGIGITYTGYALLFFSLVWLLAAPGGTFRQLLRSPMLKKGALMVALTLAPLEPALAQSVIAEKSADKMGHALLLYNGRICPMETYALDFVKKVYGKRSYQGLSAMQVLTGWIFWSSEWDRQPIIHIKNKELRSALRLPEYASMHQLVQDGYILGPYLRDYYNGKRDKLHQAAADVDEKMQLIMALRQAQPFKLFPAKAGGRIQWYSPADRVPIAEGKDVRFLMSGIFSLYYESASALDWGQFDQLTAKLIRYQQKNGGASLPSPLSLKAEHIYNATPFATILSMLCLAMGVLTLCLFIHAIARRRRVYPAVASACYVILAGAFLLLTFFGTLRWIISGTIPMANGYETMLLMAWFVMLLSLLLYHRFRIILTFGFLLSGFFLLVSHIAQMDPQITPTMPVLRSPLLSIHVSIIMMSFALLSLTFIIAVTAMVLKVIGRTREADAVSQQESLQKLSQLFLYPALATLGTGIFAGAIWANISWGQYWSWDPKEVWALITFMTYAAAAHTRTLPVFRRPMVYHAYMLVAFLTILMTYFGVNYFLGGMHSYA